MNFDEIINLIKQRVEDYSNLYYSNEQATRTQLIDPILRLLGWDPTDPSKVLPNASYEDGKRPDYTMLYNKKPILILEAKNTSVDLEKSDVIKQLAQYCYNMGVKYGILSNGKQWLFYNTFETNPNDRILWELDITKAEKENIIKLLNLLNFNDIEKIEEKINEIKNKIQIEKLLNKIWEEIFSDFQKINLIIAKLVENLLKKEKGNLNVDNNYIYKFTEKKLTELLNYTYKIDDNKTIQVINNLGIDESIPDDKLKQKIKVIFPTGETICNENVTDTFVETITRIGIERVRSLNLIKYKTPFVSNSKNPLYSQRRINKYYLLVNFSTKVKFDILQEINKKLNLGLKIELI